MKRIIVFLFLGLLLASGCKYFKRSHPKETDTIKADTSADRSLDTMAYFSGANTGAQGDAAAGANPNLGNEAVKGRYYMIVGCFSIPGNADNYASSLKTKGYDAEIISGINNYRMVAVKSYGNLKDGVAEIGKIRTEVMPDAWVYKKR
jgi:hypothetical protein